MPTDMTNLERLTRVALDARQEIRGDRGPQALGDLNGRHRGNDTGCCTLAGLCTQGLHAAVSHVEAQRLWHAAPGFDVLVANRVVLA